MTVNAATLRKLSALSLSAEQMAGVLDILATNEEADEARKAAQRERTQRAREKQRNATVTLQPGYDTRGGDARVEDKPLPTEIEPQESKRESARAVRLAENWQLPVEWRKDAIDTGLPEHLIDAEAANMRDWSLSSPQGAKRDWRAMWRNWCRKAVKDLPRARAGPPGRKPNIKDFFSALGTENADRPKPPETNVFLLPAAAGR